MYTFLSRKKSKLWIAVILLALGFSYTVRSQYASPNPVCYGIPINLFCNLPECGIPGATITWHNTSGSWTSSQTNPIILPGTPGYATDRFYLEIQYSPPPGGFSGGSVLVTVNPLPVPAITGPATACIHSTGNAYSTQTGMTGYSWTISGGTITAGAGTSAISVTWDTAGVRNVKVNYINAYGCSASAPTTYTVTVYPILTVGSISANQTICSGTAPAQLNGTAPSNGSSPTYQWQNSLDNLTFTTITGATNRNYQPGILSQKTYFREMQNATGTCGGPLPTNTLTVNVNPALPVSISIVPSANPVCSGTSVTFTATPTNGGSTPAYQWKVNGMNAGTNSPNYTFTPANNDAIMCVLTSNATCATGNPATSNTITITEPPELSLTATVTHVNCDHGNNGCIYTQISGGVMPYQYNWSTGATTSGICDLTAGTYCVTVTDFISCTKTGCWTVTEPSELTLTATMTTESCVPFHGCIYSQVTGGTAPYQYIWSNDATTSGICGLVPGTYCVTVVDSHLCAKSKCWTIGGCEAKSVCYGDPVQLFCSHPEGCDNQYATFHWKNSSNTWNSSLKDPVINPGETGYGSDLFTLTLQYEPPPGGFYSMSYLVTVNPFLPVSVSISASANPVCSGIPVTFTASPVNGGTTPAYQWSVNGTTAGINSANYTYLPANNDQVKCILNSNAPCKTGNPATSNTINMNVGSLPTVSAGAYRAICFGSETTIGSTALAGSTYSWTSVPPGFTSTLANPTVSPVETTLYTLTESVMATGCTNSQRVVVTVNPLPAASAGPYRSISFGSGTTIGAAAIAGSTYSWTSAPAGFASTLANPTVSPMVTTNYKLTETITVTGCTNKHNVLVTVNPYITVTSPNGGENWEQGSVHNITWNDNIGSNIKIFLYKTGLFLQQITASTPSNGIFSWAIPSCLQPGNDYRIKIINLADNNINDISDAAFSISCNIPNSTTIQNVTINNGQTAFYDNTQTITVAGSGTSFTVYTGGSATMIAGERIVYYPGTVVEAGGYMHGYINADTRYCCCQAPLSFEFDSVYCNGLDPMGQQLYHYSLKVNNGTSNIAHIASVSSPDGMITGISPTNISPGSGIISGNLFVGQSALTRYGFFSFKIGVTWPSSADTCRKVVYLTIPNCSGNVCDSNLIQNGTLMAGIIPGPLSGNGHVNNWNKANGDPVVLAGEGCNDPGYFRMQGNKTTGDAVSQALFSNNKIKKGNWYKVSMCLRLDSTYNFKGTSSFCPPLKIRAMAFNSTLPEGPHAPPSDNASIIGYTGLINSTEWTTVELDNWYAYKDFDNIAINIYNNSTSLNSIGYVDDVCLHAVTDTCDCDGFERDSLGNVIIPAELLALMDTEANSETEDSVEMFMGRLKDIYGELYNGNDTFYSQTPDLCCLSIGGKLPHEVDDYNPVDSLAALGIDISVDSIRHIVGRLGDSIARADSINFPLFEDKFIELTNYPNIQLDSLCFCDTTTYLPDPQSPFNGMDIVFVHGFSFSAIPKKILHPDDSYQGLKIWPRDKESFFIDTHDNKGATSWKGWADDYWAEHIQEYLKNHNYTNRYIIVAYATTQRLPFAVHAMLTQIHDAMMNGQGVVRLNPNDPRGTSDFGKNGYVIISHSTGALVTNVAMAAANSSNPGSPVYNFAMQTILGHAYQTIKDAKLHVSIQGAISGSNWATLALAIAGPATSGTVAHLYNFFNPDYGLKELAQSMTAAYTSILVDLVPQVSQVRWMNPISLGHMNPISTLTIAGGSPGGWHYQNTLLSKSTLFPGFDDGVLTMESQAGNPLPASLMGITFPYSAPAGYHPTNKIKTFDMGIGLKRALSIFTAQFLEGSQIGAELNASAGCTPFLSPTGMVQPYETNSIRNSLYRYYKHYSFIQSTSDHYAGPTGDTTWTFWGKHIPSNIENIPYSSNNYEPSFGEQNYEEESVITDQTVFDEHYVNPSFQLLMERVEKGQPLPPFPITFPPKWFCKKCKKQTIMVWLWRRNYDRLHGFGEKMECDYLYDYVLKP